MHVKHTSLPLSLVASQSRCGYQYLYQITRPRVSTYRRKDGTLSVKTLQPKAIPYRHGGTLWLSGEDIDRLISLKLISDFTM
jgi:hypothetical protein